jgi:hypothetical protein
MSEAIKIEDNERSDQKEYNERSDQKENNERSDQNRR